MRYTNYTNIDAAFCRPYQQGDRLVRGYSGEIPWLGSEDNIFNVFAFAEGLFEVHNRDDRPDGKLCPSMSVGDVVIIGEVALSVDRLGFVRVDVQADDLITDRTWTEMAR